MVFLCLNKALLHYFLAIMGMGNKLYLHFPNSLLGIAITVCMLPKVSYIMLCVGTIQPLCDKLDLCDTTYTGKVISSLDSRAYKPGLKSCMLTVKWPSCSWHTVVCALVCMCMQSDLLPRQQIQNCSLTVIHKVSKLHRQRENLTLTGSTPKKINYLLLISSEFI